uniref:Uncharacterized protein n=1 Tax=Anguilla anguilla TaxID=7936 RepID=A0A0E9XN90_ANGAN
MTADWTLKDRTAVADFIPFQKQIVLQPPHINAASK